MPQTNAPSGAPPPDYSGPSPGYTLPTGRWDDPPPTSPPAPRPAPPSHATRLVERTTIPARAGHEVLQLAFTGADSHLVVAVTPQSNHAPQARADDGLGDILVFELPSLQEPTTTSFRTGSFAVSPAPSTATVLVAFRATHDSPGLAAQDLVSGRSIRVADLDVRAPLACRTAMEVVVAVSLRDPRRMLVLAEKGGRWTIARVLAAHMAKVTHLALMPDETVVVSADEDGWVRMTELATGKLVRKVQMDTRVGARLMQVARDGRSVVTVWGTQVLVWMVEAEEVATYNLDDVRPAEGWPLAVSPDCRLLASRTEEGIEVVDARTGELRAEYPLRSRAPLVTAAAFNHRGDVLAVGNFDGAVTMLDVVSAV